MFQRKKKDQLDIQGLNDVISTLKNVLKIGFILVVLSLVVLVTYLLKAWKILEFFKTILLVLSPFFIGLVIAWLLDPLVTWLKKKGINRVFGSVLVYLVLIGFIYLLIRLMVPTLSDQINDFVGSIPNILSAIKDFVSNMFERLGNATEFDLSSTQAQIFKSIEDFGISLATKLPDMIVNIMKSILSGGMTLLLGFMLGFYMLFDFHNVEKHLLVILPKKWHSDVSLLTSRLNGSLRGFVQGTLFIMLIVFVAQSIGLSLAGLKAPLLFGLFCAVTNVIPYLGPYIGGAPAVIVGFSQSPVTGIFCLVSIVVVQLIESNFLQPIVMGKAMKLHPVTIMVSLLIFEHFFGIVGMILATPIVACLKILVSFANSKIDFLRMIKRNEEVLEEN